MWAALTGMTPDIQPDYIESVLMDEPYESLATVLAGDGYRSAFFQMSLGSFQCQPGYFANLGFDRAWFRENLEDETAHLGYMNGDDLRLLEPIFEWVDDDRDREDPFCLVLITSLAHDPFALPEWFDEPELEDWGDRYLQTVRATDVFVEKFVEQLDRRGLAENTLLCVLGDHGDSFRPDARRTRAKPYEEVLRVPWVIRWPGHVEAGTRIEWPCAMMDLTPTVLDLLGYGIEDAGFEGKSAMEPSPSDRRLFFSSWYRNSKIGYMDGSRKLVYWPYRDTLLAYDLEADPREESPALVTGEERDRVVAEILAWQNASRLSVPPRRYRETRLYDHWEVMSSGRYAKAYYAPSIEP
jgi:lipoteichoic acid synthase